MSEHPNDVQIREAYDATFRIKKERRYLLHNRTPQRIRILRHGYGEIVVPPLAERVVRGSRLAPFEDQLREARQHHQLRVRAYSRPQRGSRLVAMALWVAAAVLVTVCARDVLLDGTLARRDVIVAAVAFGTLLVGVLAGAALVERIRRDEEEIADAEEGDIEYGLGGAFYDGNETLRRTKQAISLLTIIAIGAILPALAIFIATDGKDFITMRGGLDVVDGTESRLVGRLIQCTYTAVLSLFPAILYFQFDRHRVGTIRSEWIRAIFRMDKRMETLADIDARYGDTLAEASNFSTDSVRLLGGRNSPIVVATLLISLGWTLLVLQSGSFDFAATAASAATAKRPFFQFLVPTPSVAAMAFLGAYFFGMYLLLRGYFRGDLKPKVYNQISARLITVVVLAYLIQTLFYNDNGRNDAVWAMSFMAGVVPSTFLRQLRNLASAAGAKFKPQTDSAKQALADAFSTPRALTQLDGVDIHDSARLESEGITDVPSLAKADLVSIMVDTRLPIERLIDWVDQAVLILLLDDGVSDGLDDRIVNLRQIGIRTASSVLDVASGTGGDHLRRAVNAIVAIPDPADEQLTSLDALAAEIKREPAMRRIRQWYASDCFAVDSECPTLLLGDRAGLELVA